MRWEDAPLHELSRFYASQLIRWVDHGRPPDTLILAVLENDLRAAMSQGRTLPELQKLIEFIDLWVPGQARGGIETLERWARHSGRSGHYNDRVHWLRPENE